MQAFFGGSLKWKTGSGKLEIREHVFCRAWKGVATPASSDSVCDRERPREYWNSWHRFRRRTLHLFLHSHPLVLHPPTPIQTTSHHYTGTRQLFVRENCNPSTTGVAGRYRRSCAAIYPTFHPTPTILLLQYYTSIL